MTKRCFKHFDKQGFKNEMKASRWLNLYMSEDVNEAAEMLTKRVTELLDKYAPVRTIQVRSRYAPWLSDETKSIMKERNLAQQFAQRTQNPDDKREYAHLRNRVTKMIRADKRNWESLHLDHLTQTPANLWKNVKGLLDWKNCGPPTQLFSNGHFVNSPSKLAKVMNNFFVSKVKLLQDKLPLQSKDPLQYLQKFMSGKTAKFELRQVHPDEVMSILRSLKNSRSTGWDFIDVDIIKMIAPFILPSLTHIVNLSITNSVFPTEWKKAKIVPLLKKGNALQPQNYRPVALLPVLSKVLEKVVFKQIMEYVENNKILHPSHHGSRPNHSTGTALIEMYTSWIDAVEAGQVAAVMMLDLSAAFDLVDHNLLLCKLEIMGFQTHALKWMKSYLNDRSQCVYIDGNFSEYLPVTVGVPQGSVLGALLYILFVNELPEVACSDTVGDKLNDGGESLCS